MIFFSNHCNIYPILKYSNKKINSVYYGSKLLYIVSIENGLINSVYTLKYTLIILK